MGPLGHRCERHGNIYTGEECLFCVVEERDHWRERAKELKRERDEARSRVIEECAVTLSGLTYLKQLDARSIDEAVGAIRALDKAHEPVEDAP